MYCKNCGHDEPEIKINNKFYCSNCGLALEEKLEEDIRPSVKKEEKNIELSSVFSDIGSTLEKNEGGSYRSKDFSILNKPQIKKHLSYEPDKPVQKMIEKELDLKKEGVNTENPSSMKVDLAQPEEEGKKELPILDTSNKDLEEETTIIQDKKTESILGDILSELDIKEEKNISSQKEPGTMRENITKDIEIKEDKQEEKRLLENSIKKVDELGAAKKLIDILQEQEKEKSFENKRVKVHGLGKSLSGLLDILNQPIKSPDPIKHKEEITNEHLEKILHNLQGTKEIGSPLDREEITPPKPEPETIIQSNSDISSPIAITPPHTPPISDYLHEKKPSTKLESVIGFPPKDNEEVKEESEALETQAAEALIPYDKIKEPENITLKEKEEQNEEEKSIKEKKKDFFSQSKGSRKALLDELSKLVEKTQSKIVEKEEPEIIKTAEQITDEFSKLEEVEKKKVPDEILEEEEKIVEEDPHKPLTKEELEKIESEIHALGDKKGHLDHWPEEEVKKPNAHHHVLTDFLKTIVHPEKKHEFKKEKKKKVKEKRREKKRIRKKLKRINKVFLVLTLIFIIFFAFLVSLNFLPDVNQQNSDTTRDNNSLSLDINYPNYVPRDYKKNQEIIINDAVNINYVHMENPDNNFVITEQKNPTDLFLIDYAKKNSKAYVVSKIDFVDYFILDENIITWTNENIWYILKNTGDLNLEELKKISSSIN